MKRILPFVFILLSLSHIKASDTLTIRQVFNFDVGDTFDYKTTYTFYPYSGGSFGYIHYNRFLVTSKFFSFNNDSIYYTLKQLYPINQIEPMIITNLDSNLFLIDVGAFDSTHVYSMESETVASGVLNDSTPYFTFSFLTEGSTMQTEYGKGIGIVDYLNEYNYFMLDPDGTPYYMVDGINNIISESNIHLYPNPTTGQLNLPISGAGTYNTQFILTDILGQEVYSSPVTQSESIHDISNLASGIYTWRVLENNSTIKTGKIVKQ